MRTFVLLVTFFAALDFAYAEMPMPSSRHVVVIVEENHSYGSVIGNSSMPYFNRLANTYGLARNYYATARGSLTDYLVLTGGSKFASYGCNGRGCSSTITADNLIRHMIQAGLTWKGYFEGLPYPGYLGYQYGHYDKWHNPLAWYSDVAWSSQKYNMVPIAKLYADLQNNSLPAFSFILPDSTHDAYVGSPGAADKWLSQIVPKLLANAAFRHDGILFILFDEGTPNVDTSCSTTVLTGCGGHVAALVIGPRVKPGFRSNTYHKHQAILRSMIQALGLSSHGFPGMSATVANMGEFFR
ncbi:MAG TPA: alkaline phosphatase family protein [Terriglobales bacterium]|jgi:acid phosphatase|nr:alkaline phosphatase family protein [Terriglobales bacterium]